MLAETIMKTKQLHYISGLVITIFIGLHLFNHICSIFGPEVHISVMTTLRLFYRNVIVEAILLLAVLVQIISGLKLFKENRKTVVSKYEKLHVWTGLYLAIFFIIHLSAIMVGRLFLNLDTNFYFGVAGLNSFPLNLFFIPYYALAIIAFFGHVACIHNKKVKRNLFSLTPTKQSTIIFIVGICLAIVILFGLTNHFRGVKIPNAYHVLIGK